jgi:hypothetical protein
MQSKKVWGLVAWHRFDVS